MTVLLRRLPHLDLLRGFVAVGRRMSITQAADDLYLTQSAVSRQIRSLETALGVKLFVRGHRSLAFTAEGERLFRSANSAVQQLQDAIGVALANGERRPVTVTASIGVAGLWLLPRLGGFQRRYPNIDVRVAANNRRVDLRGEDVDLAIRYCSPTAVPDDAVRLFGETLGPVAPPSLGSKPIGSAKALAAHVLLEFDDPRRPWLQWEDWLQARGWANLRPKGKLRFNQYDQIIQAAVSGQGVALGRLELLEPMLVDQRLCIIVTPRGRRATDYAYWLIQADTAPRAEVVKVAAWIVEQARRV